MGSKEQAAEKAGLITGTKQRQSKYALPRVSPLGAPVPESITRKVLTQDFVYIYFIKATLVFS